MSGKEMIQTMAESKSMENQVGFQSLAQSSEWIQDWNEQLGIGNKTTGSLGLHHLSQGWWSHHLKIKSLLFSPKVKLTIAGKRVAKINVQDTEADPGLQVRYSTKNLKCGKCDQHIERA